MLHDHFSINRPKYVNYGRIGFYIGHEMTHGFDHIGNHFDFNRDLKDWWQATTKERYFEKTTCIKEQYGNYTDSTYDIKVCQ